MKKDSTPAKFFGLTQKDMAMLLGVSVGHYSMFESGLRQLPPHASKLLNEMIVHMHKPEVTLKAKAKQTAVGECLQNELQKMQRENTYQQLLTQKKIEAITKKHDAESKLLRVNEFFANSKNRKLTPIAGAPEMIASMAAGVLRGETAKEKLKLQIKLETLQFEGEIIKRKLNKYKTQIPATQKLDASDEYGQLKANTKEIQSNPELSIR